MDGKHPVLLVHHDEEDGRWQFLTGEPIDMSDALVVGLESVVRLDATLFDVADLLLGWQATRKSGTEAWKRSKSERSDDDADQI